MEPKREFLPIGDDFPEPHMEPVKVSEAERLAAEFRPSMPKDVMAEWGAETAAELRRLAAVERACDGWKRVSKQWRGAAEIIHGMSKEDAQSLKELRADSDRLAAEVEALRADAERYRVLRRGQHWSVINGIGDTLRADELDAAIDAAKACTT